MKSFVLNFFGGLQITEKQLKELRLSQENLQFSYDAMKLSMEQVRKMGFLEKILEIMK